MLQQSAIVIGAGIVGLAHARALALKGYRVTVIERHPVAVGASVRNFGMVWPVGQPSGRLHERAMRSRAIWKQVCDSAGIWYHEAGSLHIATTAQEALVMQELAAIYSAERNMRWVPADLVGHYSTAVNTTTALGALHSPHELIVESRQAIQQLPAALHQQHHIEFVWGTAVTRIQGNTVYSGTQQWQADVIFVCSGADFETLYPNVFATVPITKCKLQMMRLQAQPGFARMGAALCGGLSLIHYKSFEAAASLPALRKHYEATMPLYLQWGIHVMACQNEAGEITAGDTHEYGPHQDPFDKAHLNEMVLRYLETFARFQNNALLQTWNGTYAKMQDGSTEYIHKPANNIWIVNGLGGAGMTLSFGLAEEVVQGM